MEPDAIDQTGTEWSEATKRTVAIAGILVGVFVLYISRPVIPFIVLAAIVAFLLNPIVVFFHTYLRMPRWWASPSPLASKRLDWGESRLRRSRKVS